MVKIFIPTPMGAKKPSRRANFTVEIKKKRLKKQLYKCALCPRMLYDTRLKVGSESKRSAPAQYDHKNTKNWENTFSNCQALCGVCHDKKSRKAGSDKTKVRNIREARKRSEARKPPTLSKQLRKDKFRPFKI